MSDDNFSSKTPKAEPLASRISNREPLFFFSKGRTYVGIIRRLLRDIQISRGLFTADFLIAPCFFIRVSKRKMNLALEFICLCEARGTIASYWATLAPLLTLGFRVRPGCLLEPEPGVIGAVALSRRSASTSARETS